MPTTYPSREDHEDLGDGVSFTWYRGARDDKLVGLAEYHPTTGVEGRICYVLAAWVDGYGYPANYQLTAGGPGDPEHLTLTPKLVCDQCGHSGSITDGKWVPSD
jgi:hypothetical protein